MRLSYIKEYIKLARSLNYTQAAEELFITQPVLSRHILALEDLLGVKLLKRSTHDVALTAEGQLALDGFEQIIDRYETLQKNLKSKAGGLSGSLAFGILYYAIDGYFNHIIGSAGKALGNINFSLVSYQPPNLGEDLLRKKIDFGLTLKPAVPQGSNVGRIDVNQEKLVLLCSEASPLARFRQVGLNQFKDRPFVFIEREAWHEPYMTNLYNKNNCDVKERIYTEQIDTLADTIIENNAVSIMSNHISSMNRKKILFIPIKNKDFTITMSITYLTDNDNPCVKIFLAWLTDNIDTIALALNNILNSQN